MAIDQNKSEQSLSVEQRLRALYELQTILSEIDRIKTIRGELPEEVRDLEDHIEGLHTRIDKFHAEIEDLRLKSAKEKNNIEQAQAQIATYKQQLDNVRNNREFDLLSKEIEFQTLEIQLSEKRINQYAREIENKTADIAAAEESLSDRNHILVDSVTSLKKSCQRPRKTKSVCVLTQRKSNLRLTHALSQLSSVSARMPATVSALSTSSVTPVADASTAFPRRSRWKSRCTRKSSSVNTADVS